MNQTKDLNWLSAPAFLLICGMIFISAKKSGTEKQNDGIKEPRSILISQK